MMIAAFRGKRHARHEPEGGIEAGKAEFGLDGGAAFYQMPSVEFGQRRRQRVIGQQLSYGRSSCRLATDSLTVR